jgi:hypothetical protein
MAGAAPHSGRTGDLAGNLARVQRELQRIRFPVVGQRCRSTSSTSSSFVLPSSLLLLLLLLLFLLLLLLVRYPLLRLFLLRLLLHQS